MPLRFLCALALPLLLFAGCTVGPDHERPTVAVHDEWQTTGAALTSAAPDAAWWRSLDDPLLVDCIEQAAGQNPTVAAAHARVREARALRSSAAASLWPTLDASAAYSRSRLSGNAFGTGAFLGGIEDDLFDVGFDAGWEIDIFGGNRRRVEAADARLDAAVEARRDLRVTIAAEVARDYVELRGAQRQLAVAESNVALQQQTLDLVQERRRSGVATELEVSQARAQLEQTRASIPPLRAAVRAAAYRLAVLTGRTPDALLGALLPSGALPAAPRSVPLGMPADLLRRRPDLRHAERELHALTAEIGVATANLYPRFFLVGAGGVESTQFGTLFDAGSLAFSFGPAMTWPIFQGGRLRANVTAADARRDEALHRFRDRVLRALEEVETAVVRYAEAREERQNLAESRAAQTRAVELARALYAKGLRDFLTVLDAEQRLNEIDADLARSETDVLRHLVAIYKALGGGWEPFEPDAPAALAAGT